MTTVVEGRVWKFGDQINTDLILPVHAALRAREVQRAHVFEANRPGWVDLVQAGDVIVAGHSFGLGSGRPAPRVLIDVGISAVIADSVNGLFFQNCVAYGLPCAAARGVSEAFQEGQHARLDLRASEVTNLDSGVVIRARPAPPSLVDRMTSGGTLPYLLEHGYVEGFVE